MATSMGLMREAVGRHRRTAKPLEALSKIEKSGTTTPLMGMSSRVGETRTLTCILLVLYIGPEPRGIHKLCS
jgi:hypothetical protein